MVGYKWKRILLKIFPRLENYCIAITCVILHLSLSSFSCYSASRIRNFGIVNRYSWFGKSVNMADQRGALGFFQGIHAITDITIDIFISIRPITTKFGKQKFWLKWGKSSRCWWCHHVNITSQIKTIVSPLPQSLWPPNLAGWWLTLSGFYPWWYSTVWSHCLGGSRDKL